MKITNHEEFSELFEESENFQKIRRKRQRETSDDSKKKQKKKKRSQRTKDQFFEEIEGK